MKRKKLITLLCAALVLSLASTGLALGLKETSDARELQKLTERLEAGNGQIPDDFTREDMEKFLDLADNETAARILKKIAENAHAVDMPIVDDGEYIPPPSNTPLTYYQYDYETGEESFHTYEPSVK